MCFRCENAWIATSNRDHLPGNCNSISADCMGRAVKGEGGGVKYSDRLTADSQGRSAEIGYWYRAGFYAVARISTKSAEDDFP